MFYNILIHFSVLSIRLLPTLQKYIKQRQTLASVPSDEPNTSKEKAPVVQNTHDRLSLPYYNVASPSSPPTRIPGSVPPEMSQLSETTWEMLSRVAWMAEELLRASQEKFNISQANHDSVMKPFTVLILKIIDICFTGGKTYLSS